MKKYLFCCLAVVCCLLACFFNGCGKANPVPSPTYTIPSAAPIPLGPQDEDPEDDTTSCTKNCKNPVKIPIQPEPHRVKKKYSPDDVTSGKIDQDGYPVIFDDVDEMSEDQAGTITCPLPTYIDYNDNGMISPTLQQMGCQSCWAISASGVLAAHAAIQRSQKEGLRWVNTTSDTCKWSGPNEAEGRKHYRTKKYSLENLATSCRIVPNSSFSPYFS